jgi:hypothetical protein
MKMLKEIVDEIESGELPFYIYVLYKQTFAPSYRKGKGKRRKAIYDRPQFAPFYVGKAVLRDDGRDTQRIMWHEYEAALEKPPKSKEKSQNRHKVNTIRKIWRNGGHVFYAIDSWHDNEAEAYCREKELITVIGRRVDGTGPLTNLTEGGEKESATIPQETRDQISNSLKKYYVDPKNRESNSERVKKYFEDNPQAREQARKNAIKNNAAENLARWRKESPEELAESRARQIVSHKEWYERNPQEARALAERRNEKLRTDAHREKMAEKTRAYNEEHPEEHQKRREKAVETIRKNAAEHNEVKQRCLWLMHYRLVALGEIEPKDKITFKTIANWRKKGLIAKYFPTMPFGNVPTQLWIKFLEENQNVRIDFAK